MKYFLHDSAAFQDEKVTELFMAHGYEGLGLFYTVLEKLACQEKPIKTVVLKKQLSVGKKLEKCWCFMEQIGIISSNNGETFYNNLLKFSEKYQISKEKNRKRVADWRENQAIADNVMRNESVRNAPKEKINKEKQASLLAGAQADSLNSSSKPKSAKVYRYDNAPVFERTAFKEYLAEIGFSNVDWSLYLVQMQSKIKNASADPKSRLNEPVPNEKWKGWIVTYLNNDKRDDKLLLPDKQADAAFFYRPEPKPEEGPLTPEIIAFRQKLQDEQDAKLLENVARFSQRP